MIDFKRVEVGDKNPAGSVRFTNDAILAQDAHALKAARVHYSECVIHRRRWKDAAVEQRDSALRFEPESGISIDPIGACGEPCPGRNVLSLGEFMGLPALRRINLISEFANLGCRLTGLHLTIVPSRIENLDLLSRIQTASLE